ncbi:DMT family transporter [Oxynema sp. CENA135]|uniref:DMT family transporter n=1 Tax=Oxynema sp. CENA135 TaxID=984206 RepID=UPI001909DD09|nr:DMT family transporter [Oxynema sp. CENA135]MBK4730991.1 DMT family transporter [Oxynema sp. CENA135]
MTVKPTLDSPVKNPLAWKLNLTIAVGVLAVSTAAIFIRLTLEAAGTRGIGFSLVMAATRLTIASLLLAPAWRNLKPARLEKAAIAQAALAGVFLALHFAGWIASLSYTSIAASTTIVTMNPIWVSLLSWWIYKDKPTKMTAIGIAIALMGGMAIGLGDSGGLYGGSNPILGDLLALLGSWTISIYLLLAKSVQSRGMGIGPYSAIVCTCAALVLLPMPFVFQTSYFGYPTEVYFYILLMALIPQMIGHTSLNWAVRWTSPTLVALAVLFEPVASSFLGFLVFNEVPGISVLIGAIVLLFGVAIAAIGSRPQG